MSQINGALKVAQSDGGGRCTNRVARAVWKGAWRRCLPTLKVGENFPEEGHFIFGLVDK